MDFRPSFILVQLTFFLMFLFMLTGCGVKDYDVNPFTTVLRYTLENSLVKNKTIEVIPYEDERSLETDSGVYYY